MLTALGVYFLVLSQNLKLTLISHVLLSETRILISKPQTALSSSLWLGETIEVCMGYHIQGSGPV